MTCLSHFCVLVNAAFCRTIHYLSFPSQGPASSLSSTLLCTRYNFWLHRHPRDSPYLSTDVAVAPRLRVSLAARLIYGGVVTFRIRGELRKEEAICSLTRSRSYVLEIVEICFDLKFSPRGLRVHITCRPARCCFHSKESPLLRISVNIICVK